MLRVGSLADGRELTDGLVLLGLVAGFTPDDGLSAGRVVLDGRVLTDGLVSGFVLTDGRVFTDGRVVLDGLLF